MKTKKSFAVTGAFSYTGKYITANLLSQGHKVLTLTGRPDRPSPFEDRVAAYPFNFDAPGALAETLRGVDVLINTYWVRFDHGSNTHQQAVTNTRTLFQAAKAAGVKRIIHVSITNPSPHSHLPYFWGKAILEEDLKNLGVSYAILRPTVIFGQEDILINNIAWFLRHFPAFAIPGSGDYQLQPIYVQDMADLAVEAALRDENITLDAIGPETYTFKALVEMIKASIGSSAMLFHTPPFFVQAVSDLVGKLIGDVVLTPEEIDGLMGDLLVTTSPPTGQTKLSQWVQENAAHLGKRYANEIERHFLPN